MGIDSGSMGIDSGSMGIDSKSMEISYLDVVLACCVEAGLACLGGPGFT